MMLDDEYHMTTDEDLFYMDINFGIKDNLEIPIEKDLIEIGKEELNQLYENSIAKSR